MSTKKEKTERKRRLSFTVSSDEYSSCQEVKRAPKTMTNKKRDRTTTGELYCRDILYKKG